MPNEIWMVPQARDERMGEGRGIVVRGIEWTHKRLEDELAGRDAALEAANQARVEEREQLRREIRSADRCADIWEEACLECRSKLAEAEKERDETDRLLERSVETQGMIASDLARDLETAQALLTKYERAIREHRENRLNAPPNTIYRPDPVDEKLWSVLPQDTER